MLRKKEYKKNTEHTRKQCELKKNITKRGSVVDMGKFEKQLKCKMKPYVHYLFSVRCLLLHGKCFYLLTNKS